MTAAEQIRAAALQGLVRAEIEAGVIRRAMTADEVTAYHSARGVWKLKEAKRKAEKREAIRDQRANMRARRDEAIDITAKLAEARGRIDWARRNAAEKSLEAWIRTYGIGVFVDDPPPSPHGSEILAQMEEATTAGRPYQVLVARGGGKTSYAEADAAYLIATGRRRFCVIVSINAKQAQQILREINAVFTAEPFATDYPDISLPIALLDGHGRRSQRCFGRDTRVRMVTEETLLPTIVDADGAPSAASGACIRAKALKSVRGTKNGTQRPDLVILDDLQTREIAESAERVEDVLRLIRGDVMGLAGKAKASIVSTATTIAADDITERLAADPTWKTTRNPAIIRWPDEWGKAEHGLWGEYFRAFDEENALGRKHTRRGGSLALYRSNRAAMDAGADILNWGHYDKANGQISGLQRLMDAYHQMGAAAFLAEFQMEPQRMDALFEITPRLVLSRVRGGVARGGDLDGCVFTCAATDINPSYALTTAICRFDLARTCLVAAYAVERICVDSTVNDTAYNREIYGRLVRHIAAVRSLGVPLNAYGVDCGGKQWEAVTRLALASATACGIPVTAMTGRAGRSWNPNVKSRIRDPLNDTVFCRDEQGRIWLAFNADSFREQMQRAWGAEVGAPGGCSLYDGGASHSEFAVQLSNERLVAKQKRLDGRVDFLWKTKEPHDFGDCLSMCYALAASRGISGGSSLVAPAAPAILSAVNPSRVVGADDDGIVIGCDF